MFKKNNSLKFKNNSLKNKKGQTLIEVLFALGVVGLCLVALVSVTVSAIRNASFANDSSLAVQLAQEGLETARRQRDRLTWEDFKAEGDECSDVGPDSRFERCITYTDEGEDKVVVDVTVAWEDHSVEAQTFLTKW
jgi:Tfp pilus assembly protein PilV